jgi:hypothetical protein
MLRIVRVPASPDECFRTLRPRVHSKQAKWGKSMDAVAKMKDPTINAYLRGHQYVWGARYRYAAAQDQLRGLLWEDLITYLREKPHGLPVSDELERLRVA